MTRFLIAVARGVLVLIALLTVVGQVLVVPAMAQEVANEQPSASPLVVPFAIAGVAVIVCAQVALTCTWMLLARVGTRTIFDRAALRWVDGIVAAAVIATALAVAVTAMAVIGIGDAPGLLIALAVVMLACAAVAVLVGVMRGLLVDAVGLRDELAAVI